MSDHRYEDFLCQLQEDIRVQREIQGEGLKKSFVQTVCAGIPDNAFDDVRQLYVDQRVGNYRIAVDGYAFNSEENTLILIIADWHDFEIEENLTKSEAEKLLKPLRRFFELSRSGDLDTVLEFSTPERELADTIRTESIERVRLMIFTDRKVSERLRLLETSPFDTIAAIADIWGPERLFDFYLSGLDHEPVRLDFSAHPIRLTLATVGDGYKSYLGVMPAGLLAGLYQKYGGQLLEGNVRSFLTLRTSVNREIRGTIIGHPERFFIYNNGIAVTARSVEFNDSGDMIGATDFQIINGGQTTASLARAAHSDNADISAIQVAMKLTFIDDDLPEKDAVDLMQNISRCSNNQNKVSGADFSSNHPLHVSMQQCADRLVAPPEPGAQHGTYWFYERNRGSFEQRQMFLKKGAEKDTFNRKYNKKRLIKKVDLARVHLCWQQHPQIVSKGAENLFAWFMDEVEKTWETDRQKGLYGDQYFRDTVSLVIMYNTLRDQVSNQPWYIAGGYRANIVAYAISIFAKYFEVRYGKGSFNFQKIWDRQVLPPGMLAVLLSIAETVQEVLTDPNRLKQNVTEWAKHEACWKAVQDRFDKIGCAFPDIADSWRISREERKEALASAAADAKVDAGVDLMKRVMEYPYWQEALSFARGKGVLTAMQSRSIGKASMIPAKIPTEKECAAALVALELLRQEGFCH